jgi:hypothetical protein
LVILLWQPCNRKSEALRQPTALVAGDGKVRYAKKYNIDLFKTRQGAGFLFA